MGAEAPVSAKAPVGMDFPVSEPKLIAEDIESSADYSLNTRHGEPNPYRNEA